MFIKPSSRSLTVTAMVAVTLLVSTMGLSQIPKECTFEPDWRPNNSSSVTVHVIRVGRTITFAIRGLHLKDDGNTYTVDRAACLGRGCSVWAPTAGADYPGGIYYEPKYTPGCIKTSTGWHINSVHEELPAIHTLSMSISGAELSYDISAEPVMPGLAQAQQTTTKAHQSSEEVYSAASKGNNAALQQLRYRAEQGDAIAQFDMGLLYRNGENVPYDVVQAVNWFRKAAEQGNTEAQTNLAYHYAVGEGVPKDAVQSNFWYSKADPTRPNPWVTALEKNPDACFVAPCNRTGSPADPKGLIAPGNIVIGNVAVMNAKKHAPMVKEGGVYKVPVLINNTITLKFVVDSGAADVSIPADVVLTLIRAETITQSDFIGAQTYTLADGSTTSSRTFRIRSLTVGDIVLRDVLGSVADTNGDLLLGQSFLGRFKSWSIDNTSHTLILE